MPPGLRPLVRGPDVDRQLHALAPAIKARMLREGAAMLAYQPIAGAPNSFRMLIINPAVTTDDLALVLGLIDRHGEDVVAGR